MKRHSDSPTHNSDLSTNSLPPFIITLLSLLHQANHTPPVICPPAASRRILHTPFFSSIPSCWKGLTTRGAWITQLHSHPLNALMQPWSRPSLAVCRQPQHPHPHGVKGPCGPTPPHLSCSQPYQYTCPADAFTHHTSSPYYRGTGCSPTPIAGGGQAAHMKTMHSACITTCRRSAVETRITNMNDRVITQELGCRRGENASQYTELCARFNRRLDYGQARYGTREHPSKDAIQNKSNYRNERSETQIGNEQTELCSARGVCNGMDVIMSRGTGRRVFKARRVGELYRSEV